MTEQEDIQRQRRIRLAFLKYLYDDHLRVPAGYSQSIAAQDVGKAIGISEDESDRAATYLHDKRLLEMHAMGPLVGITHYGIDYVENALAHPDQPTKYFPPVNVLMIHGGVHGSQIQQGTERSSQQQTISSDQRTALMDAIEALRPKLTTIEDATAREDMVANADTAAAQLKRTSPNRAILTESFKSLRSVAEQVGAGLIVAELINLA